ncbi:hypothetical protein ACLF3G_29200 [Falsiroseomonas sp. HC035]
MLLVEDDANLQGLLEIDLSDAGFEVVLAGNGADAIARIDAQRRRC